MNPMNYYIRDAFQGLKRNGKAFIATVLLIAISLSLMGSFLLINHSATNIISFLETQVKIKVFVEEDANVKDVNQAILDMNGVASTEIESKDDMLKRMKGFFKGKEYLFEAFQDASFPYTILIEAKDENQVDTIASNVENLEGVQDIVYPQTFAKEILKWTNVINRYGVVLLIIFLFISFLTTQLAISLSIQQRQKEFRLKLMLGGKASHVRSQILFEGWIMAFLGSVVAGVIMVILDHAVFQKIMNKFPFIFGDSTPYLNTTLLILLGIGSVVGIIASWLATRGMMKRA
ncbi:hypothetical protein CN918_26665 [Priestia megaterium]|nr:hypothetical protein CN918_26665 [Priestia megaterium]